MYNKILYKNKNIFYRTTGKGNAVVLLHGFGEDGNSWNDLAAKLEKNFLVIIPDLPGSGRSEMLEGENISMDDYAGVVKEIIDEQACSFGGNSGEVSMIGHSMGGYITLAFAEKYSGQLKAFGLFHSTAFADTEEKKQGRRKSIVFIKVNGSKSFLKTSIPGLFTDEFKNTHSSEVEELINCGKSFKPVVLIQYYIAMMNRPERIHVLKTFNKPILFIIGEKDRAILLQSSLEQSHLPAVSHIHILTNAAHMGMLEEKEKCTIIISRFLHSVNL